MSEKEKEEKNGIWKEERERKGERERTIKKDLRMQMYGKRREKKERERKSRVEGRQGINEQENKERERESE